MLSCALLYPTLCDPMDCSLPGSTVHGDSPSKNTGVGCHALLHGIFPTQGSNPGLEPRSPALQVNSLPFETPGKPKNTGLGSLFLLQGILLTQELNQGLLHCRQILYQQSCQGSPYIPGYRASNRDNHIHHMFLENKDVFISSSFCPSLSRWFFWSSSTFKFGTQM